MFCDTPAAATQLITYLSLTSLPAKLLAIPPCKLTFLGDRCFSMLIGRWERENTWIPHSYISADAIHALFPILFGACLFHACMAWEGSFFFVLWKNLKGKSLGAYRIFICM